MVGIFLSVILLRNILSWKELRPQKPASWKQKYDNVIQNTYKNKPFKTILMHSFPDYYQLSPGTSYFTSCSRPCVVKTDYSYIDVVDSVVIDAVHFKGLFIPHYPGQVWIYFQSSSPSIFPSKFNHSYWNNHFNWTMTYRNDADFIVGHRAIQHAFMPDQPILNFTTHGKRKLVVSFVSNCEDTSTEIKLIKSLQRFIDIDIYGPCCDIECGIPGSQKCFDMSKDYFFYLLFENSLCKRYVIEKVYHIMQHAHVVPVVYGGADYKFILPPFSYIDVNDFFHIRQLAKFLKMVAQDKKLYSHYFAYKNEWVIEPVPFPFCDLCIRLHDAENYTKVIFNIEEWWKNDTCWSQ